MPPVREDPPLSLLWGSIITLIRIPEPKRHLSIHVISVFTRGVAYMINM